MTTLADQYLAIVRDLHEAGTAYADMRKAGPLELQMLGQLDWHAASEPHVSREIHRFEFANPITRRPVSIAPPGVSRIAGFLDGSQRTVAAWRIGVVPVYATIAAAAILLRDEQGHVRIAPGTLRLEHRWLVPCHTDNADLNDLIARIEAIGGAVHDPVADKCMVAGELDTERYEQYCTNYPDLVSAAYDAAGQVRNDLELQLLDQWPDIAPDAESWLIADGRLHLAVPRVVGLVKTEQVAQLVGADAIQLYDLPPGHRTTAFQTISAERSQESSARTIGSLRHPVTTGTYAPLVWYVRMHDATGLDARHGLVRLEIVEDVEREDISEYLDELSSWLLAERVPRATADARWAQLLYPIHLLEGMLKRHIAAQTRVWPNAG